MSEVLCLGAFVAKTLLVAVEHDVIVSGLDICGEIDGLREISDVADGLSLAESASQFERRFLTHAVGDHVGTGVEEYAWAQTVLPVVIVCQTAQRGLDASEHYGDIRKELLEDFGVDDGGVFRTHVVTAVGTIGVLGAQAAVGGVLVHHRVHAAW